MFCMFFCWSLFRFRDITYAKTLYLLSRQHVTAKTVISLKIQQNIDLLQRVTSKSVDVRLKPLKLLFHVNVRPQRRSVHSNYSQMLISRNAQARQCWYQVIYRDLKFWFHIITPPQGLKPLGFYLGLGLPLETRASVEGLRNKVRLRVNA